MKQFTRKHNNTNIIVYLFAYVVIGSLVHWLFPLWLSLDGLVGLTCGAIGMWYATKLDLDILGVDE